MPIRKNVSGVDRELIVDGESVFVAAGDTIDVSEEVAASLDEQPANWGHAGDPPAVPKRPAKSAAKADWIAFGVALGNDESDLEAKTRDELVDMFTNDDGENG
jgi:hypothetical protein